MIETFVGFMIIMVISLFSLVVVTCLERFEVSGNKAFAILSSLMVVGMLSYLVGLLAFKMLG